MNNQYINLSENIYKHHCFPKHNMFIHHQRITIIKHQKPSEKDLNKQLQWLGSSLGLFNLRDKDKSCFRIFIELIKASKEKELLSSDELAARAHLSRGTVVHHLNKMMRSGLVVSHKNKYLLRVENLETLVAEVQKDIKRTMGDLKEVAEQIDKALGL